MAALLRARGSLGWYLRPSYAMGQASDARIVTAEEIPSKAWGKWAPYLEQLRDLQFNIIAHRIPDIIGAREHCILLLLHSSGTIIATLEWMRSPGAEEPQELATLELNSYGATDPDILTGCTNPENLVYADMLKLNFVDSHFISNQEPVRVLLQLHQQRVGSKDVYRMNSESAQAEHLLRAKRRFEWLLQVGLVRQLTANEVEAVKQCVLTN